jgi:adenylate cyclase
MRGGLRALAAAALCVTAAAVALDASGALDRLEADTHDARFSLRGERPARDVAVVAIDDRTFDELGIQFPFPRSLHGKVIDRLRRAHARQVAYDVQFTEPTKAREDLALLDAVARSRRVVLATTEVGERGESNVLGGDATLRGAGARAANAGVRQDGDGVIREMSHTIARLESFPVAAAEAVTRRPVPRSSFPGGGALIDFHGPPGTVPTLSFSQVLRGRFDRSAVRGKVVVVGAAAPSLQDVHQTATSGSQVMSGPEVQANAISTVLRDFPLRRVPFWLSAALVLLLAAVAPLASLRLGPPGVAALALGVLALYAGAAQLAFGAGLVLPVVAPALALIAGTLAALGLKLVWEARERRRTREAFGRFVPEPIVEELLESGDAGRRLPGRRLDATVMFCDLRGFTSFAEGSPAERVLEFLNRYLGEMSDAILEHRGTVVSYMGDGIMAVFGSPVARGDHAQAAFHAAVEMLEVRLPRVHAWLRERDLPEFRLGVGLNSGPVMSGTVGGDRRLEYAAIGDTTNVAARLEAMTKETGGGIFVADSTRSQLDGGRERLERRGEVELRGRTEPLVVWMLVPHADELPHREQASAA